MAEQAGSPRPTSSTGDKQQQTQKPPASFSSFINKNTSTRKFAPKAIQRRRPGASQPATVDSSIAETAPQNEQTQQHVAQNAQSFQTNSPITLVGPQDVQKYPPPVASISQAAALPENDSTVQPAQPTQPATVHAPVHATPLGTSDNAPSTLQLTKPSQAVQDDVGPTRLFPVIASTPPLTDADTDSGRSPKRRRIASPQPPPASPLTETALVPPTPADTPLPQIIGAPSPQHIAADHQSRDTQAQNTPQNSVPLSAAAETADASTVAPILSQSETAASTQAQASELIRSQRTASPRQQNLPWTAINDLQEDDTVGEVQHAASRKVSAKARGKRKATEVATEQELREGVNQEGGNTSVRKAKPRGQKKDTTATVDGIERQENNEASTTIPPKKPRKPRKDKGTTKKTQADLAQQLAEGDQAFTLEEERPRRKRIRKQSQTAAPSEGDGEFRDVAQEDDDIRSRRKLGRKRQETPSDAEDREINAEDCIMGDIAARNIRFGRTSQREKNMREVNWAEIKQRRREHQLALAVNGGVNQDEVNANLERAGNERAALAESGPKFREVDGQIVIEQESTIIDHNANAQRDVENLEAVEEDDLTTQVNTQSWVLAHKRDPADRVMFGRGKRWSAQETESFYDSLAMFGTDFQMISTLFPGKTRHNVKLKFNREERDNPARVEAALKGERQSDFKQYLMLAEKDESAFIDPRELERELQEEAQRDSILIEEAKKAYEEEQRQRQLAGIEDPDAAEGEGAEKEGQGRMKRKKKEKKFKHTPVGGEDVEIVGTIDDHERGW